MYKVFLNERFIEICPVATETAVDAKLQYTDLLSFKDFILRFEHNPTIKTAQIIGDPSGILKTAFKKCFKIEKASGGAVLNTKDELLVIKRFGLWDLPKGKIEKGEKKKIAAVREVREECGISAPSIVKKLPTTYHLFRRNNQLILKKTWWFEMDYKQDEKPTPQKEEGIEEVRWVNREDIQSLTKLTFDSLKPIFQLFIR